MADKVIRLTEVHTIEHATVRHAVVLKVTGKVGGKIVRVEVSLDNYDIAQTVGQLRAGTQVQLDAWQRATNILGESK